MKKVMAIAAAVGVLLALPLAAQTAQEKTWTGKISDSMCKEKHMAGEHAGKKMTDADCVAMCTKKGEKYVFVADGKVYQLANQSSKTVAQHAGEQVELTGEMKGDTISALKIRPVPAKPAK